MKVAKEIRDEWPIFEINREDELFPNKLKKISPKIEKLYYRGNWDESIFDRSAAVIGSRRMTKYGMEVCEEVVANLVGRKTTVISGFMYGIDTEAHKNTIKYGGRTVAVLGGGLDELYPTENLELYRQILETGGLIISEYEADFKPCLWSFPQRNRIVAGLANEVYVIEAGRKSGSLITANLAYKLHKKVFAVPGSIYSPTSQGCNMLIGEAKAKILAEINLDNNEEKVEQLEFFGDKSMEILKAMGNEEMTIDELHEITKREVWEISIELTNLSLSGVVEEEGGKYKISRLRKS